MLLLNDIVSIMGFQRLLVRKKTCFAAGAFSRSLFGSSHLRNETTTSGEIIFRNLIKVNLSHHRSRSALDSCGAPKATNVLLFCFPTDYTRSSSCTCSLDIANDRTSCKCSGNVVNKFCKSNSGRLHTLLRTCRRKFHHTRHKQSRTRCRTFVCTVCIH